ncbi:hypothetical protein DA717_10825 [Piscirickettsiaceae bacterium NZ-RLO2]|uniref:phage baseplate protein n=1 Tax=Piscirickettsia salmonis TaxID=1238 RepID=UPI000F082E20|nr:hypothetical protein DA717_10825 [Piscirickettsiaceae bacterium NZ-RLO2]
MGATLFLEQTAVYIDTVESETENYRNDVTEFPVEDGMAITDDIINKNVEIEIKGVVSGSPLVFLASLSPYSIKVWDSIKSGSVVTQQYTSPADAKQLLTNFWESRKTLTLTLDDELFSNAAIAHLTFKSDADTGDTLAVEIKLKIIKTVVTKTTTVPSNISDEKVKDDSTPKSDIGNVPTKAVANETQEYKAMSAITGVL